MIKEKKLSNSVRKFIRSEKARIRSQFLDIKKQQELMSELYKKVLPARIATQSVAGGSQPKSEDRKEVQEVKSAFVEKSSEVKEEKVKKEIEKPKKEEKGKPKKTK